MDDVKATVKSVYHKSQFLNSTKDVPSGESFGILLDKTNFYAEQGGQEYDTGVIAIDGKAEFKVEDVQVFNGYVLHIGRMVEGEISVGEEVIATYDELRRWPIRNNHTGTHILNFALREVLGDHIDQKGSLVAPTKLRFDFSHNDAPTTDQLIKIEDISNQWIKKAAPVYSKEMPLAVAQKIPGLRAVFGEAYPDPVRVVSIGFPLEDIEKNIEDNKWASTSIEFCGGTHVQKTDSIKDLVITEVSSVAKGIRRVVAVTGHEAHDVSRQAAEFERKLETIGGLQGKEKDAAMKPFLTELGQSAISVIKKSQLKTKFEKMQKELLAQQKAKLAADQKMITEEVKQYFSQNPNENVYVGVFGVGGDTKVLSSAATVGKSLGKAVYLFSPDVEGGKVGHVNFLPKAVLDRKVLDAKTWLNEVAVVLGGKGGGRDESCVGVGSNVDKVQEAVETARKVYKTKVEA